MEEHPSVIYWINVKDQDIPVLYSSLSTLILDVITGLILMRISEEYAYKILHEPFSIKAELRNESNKVYEFAMVE